MKNLYQFFHLLYGHNEIIQQYQNILQCFLNLDRVYLSLDAVQNQKKILIVLSTEIIQEFFSCIFLAHVFWNHDQNQWKNLHDLELMLVILTLSNKCELFNPQLFDILVFIKNQAFGPNLTNLSSCSAARFYK